MEPQSRRNSHGLRSRRSHTSLQHISLAPLSSRFPVDDDGEDGGYFSSTNHHGAEVNSDDNTQHPYVMTSSYLSSLSVPATPSLLSQSRNVSQTNLTRKMKTDQGTPMSESRLDTLDVTGPVHHQRPQYHQRSRSHNPWSGSNRAGGTATPRTQDNEWLLRTGSALASSTREEKGQSWLVKRESSTSLVSHDDDALGGNGRARSELQGRRSGLSTPISRSRRGSVPHATSKRSSRVDLAMTPSYPASQHVHSGAVTPRSRDIPGLVPDFLDESIREELAALQHHGEATRNAGSSSYQDEYHYSDSNDEYFQEGNSETEVQLLTLERGYGLGSWLDSLVEWVVFGTDEESMHPPALDRPHWREQRVNFAAQGDLLNDVEIHPTEEPETISSPGSERSDGDQEILANMGVPPPDSQGSWTSDVRWLLLAARNAVI